MLILMLAMVATVQAIVTTDFAAGQCSGTACSFQVPPGVSSLDFEVWGPAAGSFSGYASGSINTLPTDVYTILQSGGGLTMTGPSYNLHVLQSASDNQFNTLTGALNQYLTGVATSSGTSNPDFTLRLTHDDTCEAPSLLEKTLSPVLVPTSGFERLNGVSLLSFKVDLPSFYFDVKFGFNSAEVAAISGLEDPDRAAIEQCPTIAAAYPTADDESPDIGSCNTRWQMTVDYTQCSGFVIDETDPANFRFSGTLFLYAKTTLNEQFLGRYVEQEVLSRSTGSPSSAVS